MNRLAVAGVLWIAAAAFAIAMTITFRTDALQWLATIPVGAVAAVVGLWLIRRPSAQVVSASNLVAVGWAVLYGVLAVQQSDEVAAWTIDVALIAIGVAAGLAAYRAVATNNRTCGPRKHNHRRGLRRADVTDAAVAGRQPVTGPDAAVKGL